MDSNFGGHPVLNPPVTLWSSRLLVELFLKVKSSFSWKEATGLDRATPLQMGEGGVSLTPCADFYRPVEELEYTDLLRSTFTQSGHERGFKTWRTPATLPQCVFCGNKYRWGKGEVECHMDPTITKASTDNERLVAACAESQSTSRGPNRTRFLIHKTPFFSHDYHLTLLEYIK